MKRITLRNLNEADLPTVKKWLNAPHVRKWFDDPQAWIDELEHRSDVYSWISHFIAEVDERPIGFCQYYDYSLGGEAWHNGTDISNTYSIDYMIGDPDFVGKHLASEMLLALEKEIRSNTNAVKIIVQPEPDNIKSRRTLLSAGYIYDPENDLFVKQV